MNTTRRKWSIIAVTGLIVLTMGCIFPAAGAVGTTTPQASGAPLTTLSPTIETLSSAVRTATPAPALQTATAQFGAVETLAAASGLPTGTAQSAFIATLLASINGGASPTPGGSVGGGASSGGSNSGSNGGSSNNGGNNNTQSGSTPVSATPTPTQLPPSPGGPYVVKQIETLGGEVLSGGVCSVSRPFSVNVAAPKAAFVFLFFPQDDQHGRMSYKYSIPSAGESHDATGTYTLSKVSNDGTLQLAMVVSDHVVFKGFDGNIPNRYKFNLVPADTSPCP